MKLQRVKDMVLGGVVASLVVGTVPIAFAKAANINIPVTYNNIKIMVDGKQLNSDKEPFIYEGTTYLPVRAVSEAVGKNVTWDGATNTVYLGNTSSVTAPTLGSDMQTSNEVSSYSRTNPAPIGTTQTYTVDKKFSTAYTADITITESYSGSRAWSKIEEANMFNDEAPSGKEYILVKVKATVRDVKDDKAVDFSQYSFTPFSGTNTEYEQAFVVEPEPAFSGSVYSGGTLEGYIAFLVDESDSNPKIVFEKEYDGTGGIWFSIRK